MIDDHCLTSFPHLLFVSCKMQMTKESEAEDLISKGRKDLELADYPGSGPNDDHTPKTPEAGN